MNLLIHPKKSLGIVNNFTQRQILVYDLQQPCAQIIKQIESTHSITAGNGEHLWLMYKQNGQKFTAPVFCDVWDWDLKPVNTLTIAGESTWQQSVAISADNRLLAFASIAEAFVLYDTTTFQKLDRMAGGEYISGLSFSPGGIYLAVFNTFQGGGYVGLYRIVDHQLETVGELEHNILGRETLLGDFADTFGRTAFSSDEQALFVLASNSNTQFAEHNWFAEFFCVDIATQTCRWLTSLDQHTVPDLESHENPILTDIAVSPTGETVAIGLPGGKVVELCTFDGSVKQIYQLDPHNTISAVGFERITGWLWVLDNTYQLRCISPWAHPHKSV